MSPPALIRLEARLLVRVGDSVLLARSPGDDWHELPGGPVPPGENTERALARALAGLAGGVVLGGPAAVGQSGGWRFLGATEHAGDALGNAAAPQVAHTLTILFAADWSDGAPVPPTWQGRDLVLVDAGLLVATRLRPLPVATAVRRWVLDEWPLWRGMASGVGDVGRLGRRLSVASLKAQLAARREELRGNAFRDAAVAMCALVTAADGRVDPAEREGLRAFVASDPVMSHFAPDELEALFDAHLTRLVSDPTQGRATALAEIAKVRNRPAEAAAVIALGEVIGRVDGEFVVSEQAVVLDAVNVLGLDPAEFAPASLPATRGD
ncbi:Tellurite resistance protein [Parafrankia irregularis]|uniref:Tellurite resistance protein n=1 Tax=Parafrankia irregularis TaxID=795642 RepID=A0A0S4QEA2_9ACTN|nr:MULTISPECIES: TerB family tellurite resistance protein [Parafrankia]MBE3199788.1 TerB family tellurite resistance protein [Parafrankia sp. CH37]CUU53538.1 Tellurite resistance protein [Parafrankia irregularis]